MEQQKLTTMEVSALFINLICNKFLLFAPEYFRLVANSATVLVVIVLFVFMFVMWHFMKKISVDYTNINKFFGIVLIIIFTFSSALTLREYMETVKVISLTEESLYYIVGIFITATIFGTLCSIKTIGRTNAFFVPLLFIVLSALIIFSFPELNLYMLTPVFGDGVTNIFKEGFLLISAFLEFALFITLKPYIKNEKSYKKAGNIILGISFILILLITSAYCASFDTSLSSEKYPPVFQVIRLINSNIRLDSFFLIIFSISAYLYLGAMVFLITLLFKNCFKLKNRKYAIMPFIITITSVTFINLLNTFATNITKTTNYVLWAIPVILPFLVFKSSKRKAP